MLVQNNNDKEIYITGGRPLEFIKRTIMKFCAVLLLLFSFHSNAQVDSSKPIQIFQNPQYFLPNGKEITLLQVDSIKKAWGGKVLFSYKKEEPNKMTLVHEDDGFVQKLKTTSETLNSMIGRPAPDFAIDDMQGKNIDLSELRGKVVVLNFWFVACAGCIQEMPALNNLVSSFDNGKVVFLGLALDDAAAIKKFRQKNVFNFDIIPGARNIHEIYKIFTCPVSMVIDKNGILRLVHENGRDIQSVLSMAIGMYE
jgi:peroxiredoxin